MHKALQTGPLALLELKLPCQKSQDILAYAATFFDNSFCLVGVAQLDGNATLHHWIAPLKQLQITFAVRLFILK